MQAVRRHVNELRHLPVIVRLSIIILLFITDDVLIVYFHARGLNSILLLPGILACWFFPWRTALAIKWGLLWVHAALLIASGSSLGYVLHIFISGTITDIVLVGSFGALRCALVTMQENKARQDIFISNLNHDIRIPLTGAIGALELIITHKSALTLSEETMFLTCAKASCEEIARLTDNIKDAMDPRDDVAAPRIEVFRLDIVVGELLRYLYTFEHPLEGIALKAGLQVEADPLQVQRVLRNLIHNACKYSPREAPIAVSIATYTWMDGFACVSVRDKGPGIPLEQVDQLFQKFSRLGENRIDGTGLGLYNCRRMIENMGGAIWVESAGIDGEGSRFCFTLPLAKKQEKLPAITTPYPIIDIL